VEPRTIQTRLALRDRCPRCLCRGAPCLCPEVPRVQSRVRIIIVRHAAELMKPTGTARWAALAVEGTEVHDYAVEGAPLDERALQTAGAHLLFPGGEPTRPLAHPPERLLVVDGTWQQARRMVSRLPSLRALPRLSLPPPSEERRLRRPHFHGGMSTLEAIAEALELCGEPLPARQLRALHAAVLARAERMRGQRYRTVPDRR
jgi:DTW domain-containing protein YfiP